MAVTAKRWEEIVGQLRDLVPDVLLQEIVSVPMQVREHAATIAENEDSGADAAEHIREMELP